MKKIRSLVSVLIIISLLSPLAAKAWAQESPAPNVLSATDRVKNMADEERNWRFASAGIKGLIGAGLIATGISAINGAKDNFFATLAVVPLAIAWFEVPGVITVGWAAVDLLFGSRQYEDTHANLQKIDLSNREMTAADYLKTQSAKEKKEREPSFWNGFGLFSMFEKPAEREYKAYLKDRQL
jgi:hypothetical protein